MKRVLLIGLVRLYPSQWRDEYGGELGELLMRRRLDFRAVLDVVTSAARQQIRLQQPWLLIGLPLALWISIASGYALAHPGSVPFSGGNPTIIGAVIFAGVGFWTAIRSGRAAGRAAMKLSLLVSSPLFVLGCLVLAGAAPMPFGGRVSVFQVFILGPLLQPVYAGLLGWAGGVVGRLSRRLG